jgi:hypothetical protein
MYRFNSRFKVKPHSLKSKQGLKRSRMKARRVPPAELNWAADVRERDGYTCRWPDCGYYSLKIHTHHIHTRRQRPDLVLDLENGAALCPKHHDFIHHTSEGRRRGRELGLLGTETYEAAAKRRREAA